MHKVSLMKQYSMMTGNSDTFYSNFNNFNKKFQKKTKKKEKNTILNNLKVHTNYKHQFQIDH
jgi:hypothetical protein